ncbi:enoyl-CoA hydratase/isomerase family protein [Elizabethkingia anophelis]|uniref:enoyl-CoA hydratase/isomerase family protein n=1 Tax=Elizabethkingia anophelis TaxID=1117645 RepID=UPI0008401816|nr:enoyl-CoA hydratase/isomerase family protein [Elizabethkingia anophelis]MCT3663756.1 enoyl-CoA hydratase/isomerase family protein [Elizabethkingia anophelis]MCT3906534.1 enoyl-CoA hydratase/isomerase family protein [Elizabethkingia anophelis]MCT4142286.1 enoyl-CoA hydratase/isomerase family protein [Elizabethkingia anophelis]MCT4277892.1 enoyl-CoA hydratase/isomerase family protein [Elizabethkingia anophelis]MCT4281306.1 enoyl-CoA hydratase/isomerase family protein [Elizabethkingia anopheli
MNEFVISEIKNNIAEITFGTPKSNSLPGAILEKLAQTILEEGVKKEVKAILIKSAGEKAFCAGASFDELLAIDELETSKKFFGGFAKVLNAMRNCGKIVVVRVQGKTTGGGVGIACGADYCFATKDAALALTEINLGIGPFVIGPYVERKIGKSQFSAMAIDAEFRSAEWAEEHNIYHSVSENIAEMDVKLDDFLQKLSTRSDDALALIKKVSWEGTDYFNMLMPDRIHMSASLILEDSAKKNIEAIKERLRAK